MTVVAVILWLSFSLSALAQNTPMQSVPTEARGEEEKVGNCWEETNPEDPDGCLAQIEKAIIRLKVHKTKENKKSTDMSIRFLKVDKKRIENQVKAKITVAKKQQKRVEREVRAENNADIFCPDQQQPVVIYNDGHLIYNRFQAFNRVTVVNTHPFGVRISAIDPNREKSGKVLDLPPGCTVTLSRSIIPLLETGWGGIRFSYVAQPITIADGAPKLIRSQEFFLFGGNGVQQMNTSVWELRFY